MYKIVKMNGMYRVITVSNERIMFSSAKRANCTDFMRESLGVDPKAKPVKPNESK